MSETIYQTFTKQVQTTKVVTVLHCQRCSAEWTPRVTRPKRCPCCQSAKWFIPRGVLKIGRPKK